MLYNNHYIMYVDNLYQNSLEIQKTIDKLINEIGVVGVLNKVIIGNIHFREDIQYSNKRCYKTNNDLISSDIAYIHAIPVLNEGIEKLIKEFKKSINK